MRMVGNRDINMAKHRCEYCFVANIVYLDTGEPCLEAESFNCPVGTPKAIYHVGKMVKARRYDTNENKICSEGIHFFLSKERAILYKTPFHNRLFRVWFDNGLPRYMAQTDDYHRFNGLFVEYDREGKVSREISEIRDVVTRVVQYTWKPLLVKRTPPKTLEKMFRETVDTPRNLKIQDVVPGLKAFLCS